MKAAMTDTIIVATFMMLAALVKTIWQPFSITMRDVTPAALVEIVKFESTGMVVFGDKVVSTTSTSVSRTIDALPPPHEEVLV